MVQYTANKSPHDSALSSFKSRIEKFTHTRYGIQELF